MELCREAAPYGEKKRSNVIFFCFRISVKFLEMVRVVINLIAYKEKSVS